MNPYLIDISTHKDSRGTLLTFDLSDIPFKVTRIFTLSVNTKDAIRGGHSHKECWQALIPISGRVVVRHINLDGIWLNDSLSPKDCLVLPPNNWCELIFDSSETHVLVLASHKYDKNDYIYEIPVI